MPDPVIVAVPPKGGTLNDVFDRLVRIGWLEAELVAGIRHIIKADKKRIKLEEQLIAAWFAHQGDDVVALQTVVDQGADPDLAQPALARMRRYIDVHGQQRLGFSPKPEVDAMLADYRQSSDPHIRHAAQTLHLELDLSRRGRPTRMMFDHHEFDWTASSGQRVRGVIVGTDHEVTPTYLRRHKRDISLTCYDAFHSTLLDALDTGKVHNWRELKDHLIEANTDVRICGSLMLDDYLGHFVLLPGALAERARQMIASGVSRTWGIPNDPKLDLLRASGKPVLIDANYEAIYLNLLDAQQEQIDFIHCMDDIEQTCAQGDQAALYIVQSGGTIARTPGLCVVGSELVCSETIVAVNEERLDHNPGVGLLIEALEPSVDDQAEGWRQRMAQKLGDSLI